MAPDLEAFIVMLEASIRSTKGKGERKNIGWGSRICWLSIFVSQEQAEALDSLCLWPRQSSFRRSNLSKGSLGGNSVGRASFEVLPVSTLGSLAILQKPHYSPMGSSAKILVLFCISFPGSLKRFFGEKEKENPRKKILLLFWMTFFAHISEPVKVKWHLSLS